jgi:hypothetical protein
MKQIPIPKTEEHVGKVTPLVCPRCSTGMDLRPSWDILPRYGDLVEPRWDCGGCGLLIVLPRALDSTRKEIEQAATEEGIEI